jgi:hypothetical protein
MPDEQRDDIVDEMPAAEAAPCGAIFGSGETDYVTDADDDDMPAPEGRCGDQFGASHTVHVTDADDGA